LLIGLVFLSILQVNLLKEHPNSIGESGEGVMSAVKQKSIEGIENRYGKRAIHFNWHALARTFSTVCDFKVASCR
jgi:hypothetical protein